MIHVRAWIGNEVTTEEPALQCTFTGRADILKLQALVNRALNTAPEFGEDWFALAARLDTFVLEQNLAAPVVTGTDSLPDNYKLYN